MLPLERCWSSIGVSGDRSCPELAKVNHCHHCGVFAAAAREFLDRPLPEGYVLAPASLSAEASREERAKASVSMLVFELAGEAFAIEVAQVVEAVEPRPVQRITRRSGKIFRGMVNVHGQLELYASLSGLLGVGTEPDLRADRTRMVVLSRDQRRWVVAVDRLVGVRRYSASELRAPPATLVLGGAHVQRVVRDEARTIALLDSTALFATLEGCVQ
jgi:chemotaxis-related protein WspD